MIELECLECTYSPLHMRLAPHCICWLLKQTCRGGGGGGKGPVFVTKPQAFVDKVNWEGNHKDQEPTISPMDYSMSEQGPTSITSKQPLST